MEIDGEKKAWNVLEKEKLIGCRYYYYYYYYCYCYWDYDYTWEREVVEYSYCLMERLIFYLKGKRANEQIVWSYCYWAKPVKNPRVLKP